MSELNSSTLLSTPPPYTKKKHVGIGDSPSSSKLRFLKSWVILAPPSFISVVTGSCQFHSCSLLYPSSVRSVINGHLVSFNKKIQQKLFLRYFSVLYSLQSVFFCIVTKIISYLFKNQISRFVLKDFKRQYSVEEFRFWVGHHELKSQSYHLLAMGSVS